MRRLVLLCLVCFSFAFAVDATMEIIRRSGVLPVIEVSYINTDSKAKDVMTRVHKMLIADLKVSGHFNVQEHEESAVGVDYDEYKSKGVHLVAKISTQYENSGVVTQLYLYDITTSKEALNKRYSVSQENYYPLLAHKIAVDINHYIAAPSIEWMERFVLLSKNINPGVAQIILADYTLTFQSVIINDNKLNIFPKWANKEQTEFYYTKYLGKPTLFKYNIQTKANQQILNSQGMLAITDVSRDGNKILLTMAPTSQSDIFLYDLSSKQLTQLTKYKGIDVEAHFIDNEKRVMFISDRLGYPNVFATGIDGNEIVEQLVYHGRNNNFATSFGEYIVYSSRDSNNEFAPNAFNLYLASTKSDYIRQLTIEGVNQNPQFSVDGETVMYIKHTPTQSSLGIIRLNYNKSYLFALPKGKIQAIAW